MFSGRRVLLAALVAAAVVPYFIDLGGSSIWDANEAFYVETPREMQERGDYISPTFNYEPRFNKPVLSYWVVAAFYRLFGVSVAVERLAIALGAMVMIATAFGLAWAAADRSEEDVGAGLEAALWAGLGLAIAPRLLMFSRRIFIDVYVSMFMGLSLLCFALAERYPARRRTFLVLMYLAVGGGVLTKGPVALALPGLVIFLYLAVHGELRRASTMMLPAGAAIVAAIVLPWYVALYHRYGWTYISSFLLGENIARYAEGVGVQVSRGIWYYLPVVFSDSAPFALLLFAAAAMWLADRRSGPQGSRQAYRVRTLLWLWVLAIVGFFTFSAAKQDLYIFPIVPAVAALAGAWIARAAADPAWQKGLRTNAVLLGLLLAALGLGTLYVFHRAGTVYALSGVLFVGTAGVVGGAVVFVLAFARRPAASLIALAVTIIVLNWAFVLRVLPSFERYKPVPGLSAALRERLTPDDVVAHYSVALPSMVYYLDRHIEVLFEPGPFVDLLGGERRVFGVLSAKEYEAIQPLIPVPTCIIERRPTVNMKLKAVLARDPLPEVLLISNRCH